MKSNRSNEVILENLRSYLHRLSRGEPSEARNWLIEMDKIFTIKRYRDDEKILYASYIYKMKQRARISYTNSTGSKQNR